MNLNSKFFILFFLTFVTTLSSIQRPKILLFPTAGSIQSNHNIRTIGEILLESERYHYIPLVHEYDKALWEASNLKLIIYGDSDELSHLNVQDKPTFNLQILQHIRKKEIYQHLKNMKIQAIICEIDDFPCRKISSVFKIERRILIISTCPSHWKDTFHGIPQSQNMLSELKQLLIKQLIKWGLWHYQDDLIEYDFENLYILQCIPGLTDLKPHFSNIIPVGPISSTSVLTVQNDNLNFFMEEDYTLIILSLENTINPLIEEFLKVFNEMKQYKFIIQCRNFDLGKYKHQNVIILNDVSISRLLSLSNTILLITDGNWNSVINAIIYSKPIILINTNSTIPKISKAIISQTLIGIDASDLTFNDKNMIKQIHTIEVDSSFKSQVSEISGFIKKINPKLLIKNSIKVYLGNSDPEL